MQRVVLGGRYRTAVAVAGLGLIACGVGARPAAAKLPTPKTTLIVPGKSIAGVKLGMSRAQVFGQWGSTTCVAGGGVCDWYGPGAKSRAELARVGFFKGKVMNATIIAGTSGTNLKFKSGTLSKWRTAKGVRLGSNKSAVPKAYPAAKANTGEAVQGFDLFATGSYTRFSSFGFGATPALLKSITVSREANAVN